MVSKEFSEQDGLSKHPDGIYRSKSLPRLPGKNVILPAQIDCEDGTEQWDKLVNDPSSLVTVELFSGAGGLSLGFANAGFFVAAGIDKDPSSIMTHGYNFLSKSVQGDLSEVENPRQLLQDLNIPRVDVIIGGPPCQGFSRVGRGKLRSVELEEYYTTVINELYREFIRFVAELRPKVFLMENVPDMAKFNNGELLDRIVKTFEDELGYRTSTQILNAVDYGVPQKRSRLFVQGNRMGVSNVWPDEQIFRREAITVREAISDLPPLELPATDEQVKYSETELSEYQANMRAGVNDDEKNIVFDHITRNVRDDDRIIFSIMKEGDRYCDIPEELRRYRSDIFKDKYWKLYWDQPSWTVTAHIRKDSYRYIHPDPEQGRMLSIREFARLQSFPDNFRFCGAPTRRMQQIGNAVPPLLAQKIAEAMYNNICSNL